MPFPKRAFPPPPSHWSPLSFIAAVMVCSHMLFGKLICVFTACPVHMQILEGRDHICFAHHDMPIVWNKVWHRTGVQWQHSAYYLFNTKVSKASTIQPLPTSLAISYGSLFPLLHVQLKLIYLANISCLQVLAFIPSLSSKSPSLSRFSRSLLEAFLTQPWVEKCIASHSLFLLLTRHLGRP